MIPLLTAFSFSDEIKSRLSAKLSRNRFPVHYMWAGVYAGEHTRDVLEVSLGDMNVKCGERGCSALYWQAERLVDSTTEVPFWCCNKSTKAILTERGVFRDIQDDIVHELYFEDSDDAEHFRRHIRAYNHVLTTAVPLVNYGRIFRRTEQIVTVNGKVTFRAPSCPTYGDDGLPATAGQLFFIDVNDATVSRRAALSTDPHLRHNLLRILEWYLRTHNHFVQTFQLAGRIERELIESGEHGRADGIGVV